MAVQAFVPLRERPEARRDASRDHLKGPADRILGLQRFVNLGLHAQFGHRVNTTQNDFFRVAQSQNSLKSYIVLSQRHSPDGNHVACDFDPEFLQKEFGQSACRHSSRGLASAGALENIARVAKIVFQAASQVGVSGARRRKRLVLGSRVGAILNRQRFFPIFPIAILDQDRDGRAHGLAVANPGKELRRVRLDFHAPAAPVPPLASFQFTIHVGEINT